MVLSANYNLLPIRLASRGNSAMVLATLLLFSPSWCHGAVLTNLLGEGAESENWKGFVDAGMDLSIGDDKSRSISIDAAAERIGDDFRWEVSLEYLFEEEDLGDDGGVTKIQDEIDLESQYDIFFTDQAYVWLLQALYADDVDGLELGIDLGVGLGYQFATRGRLRKLQYEVEGGMLYSRLDFAPDESEGDLDESLRGTLLSHEFTYKFKRGIVFQHELSALRIADKPNGTTVEMENGLAISMGRDFFLRISHEAEWDEAKSKTPGESSTEQQLTLRLGWKFE